MQVSMQNEWINMEWTYLSMAALNYITIKLDYCLLLFYLTRVQLYIDKLSAYVWI